MPRTKRNKLVSLTKTPKRNTRDAKAGHMDAIQRAAAEYPTCVVFLMTNQRTSYLQEVRSLWKENSQLFVGKNRVVAKALGVDQQSEVRTGLSGISKRLEGPVGLLFTTSTPDEVQEWFDDYSRDDFARAGGVATSDVILQQGPIMLSIDPPEPLPHSLEPQLRKLGMPSELRRGVPTLVEPFVVCKKGERLTSEKAQILKHLLIKDAKFRLVPVVYWTQDTEKVSQFSLSDSDQLLVKQSQRMKRATNDDDDLEDDDLEDPDAHMMMPSGM